MKPCKCLRGQARPARLGPEMVAWDTAILSAMKNLTCFKAYDVRGRVPEDLDEEIAYRIGRAYAAFLEPGERPADGFDR